MSLETTGEPMAEKTGGGPAAVKREWKCPLSDRHIHREDVRKVWKECEEESFWYRALPLSLGSMTVTGGLIYKGIWNSSKRFGPFPKLAAAGILGYAVGKATYIGTCRDKFKEHGLTTGPCSDGGHMGPAGNIGLEHKSCHHVCKECTKTAQAAPAEHLKS